MVIPIFPVWAVGGTDTVICESESTLKFVVTTPPNVTFEVCFRLTPVTMTLVPTVPTAGLNPVICGFTRNVRLLVSVPLGVFTVKKPLVAPLGTRVLRNVSDTTTRLA